MCVRACVFVCARVCVFAGVGAGVRLRACSVIYPACNTHAPYSPPTSLASPYFRHYLLNVTVFGKKVTERKCVFRFSLQFLNETNFRSKKNSARDCHKCE